MTNPSRLLTRLVPIIPTALALALTALLSMPACSKPAPEENGMRESSLPSARNQDAPKTRCQQLWALAPHTVVALGAEADAAGEGARLTRCMTMPPFEGAFSGPKALKDFEQLWVLDRMLSVRAVDSAGRRELNRALSQLAPRWAMAGTVTKAVAHWPGAAPALARLFDRPTAAGHALMRTWTAEDRAALLTALGAQGCPLGGLSAVVELRVAGIQAGQAAALVADLEGCPSQESRAWAVHRALRLLVEEQGVMALVEGGAFRGADIDAVGALSVAVGKDAKAQRDARSGFKWVVRTALNQGDRARAMRWRSAAEEAGQGAGLARIFTAIDTRQAAKNADGPEAVEPIEPPAEAEENPLDAVRAETMAEVLSACAAQTTTPAQDCLAPLTVLPLKARWLDPRKAANGPAVTALRALAEASAKRSPAEARAAGQMLRLLDTIVELTP